MCDTFPMVNFYRSKCKFSRCISRFIWKTLVLWKKKRGNFHSEIAREVFSLTHTWPAEGGLCSEQYPFKTAWAESDTIVELAHVCSMVLGTLPPPQQLLFPLPPWLYLFYLGCRCTVSQIPFDEVLLLCSHDLYFWNNISLNLPGWQGSLRLLI